MKRDVGVIFFSPTGTTRENCMAIAKGMGSDTPHIFDATKPEIREKLESGSVNFENISHLIFGAPVYSGKLPLPVIKLLKKLKLDNISSTAIVVYGNRDYGISLHTMVTLLTESGSKVNSAGTFIGEHSYSDLLPIASGRPDKSDLNEAFNFGKSIGGNMCKEVDNIPIKLDRASKSKKYTSITPSYDRNLCTSCGACSKSCPLGILSSQGSYISIQKKKSCLGCMACAGTCQTGARFVKVNPVIKVALKKVLKDAIKSRKEPFTIF